MSTKYYVVWKGRRPGVYDSWDLCRRQVEGFAGAQYKSFPSLAQAQAALSEGAAEHVGRTPRPSAELLRRLGECYAVDAACSGNPGELEYRCVHLPSGRTLFHRGPFAEGTNNVGEFLALAEALMLFGERGIAAPIYSDSKIALGWLKAGKCKTQLAETRQNRELFARIAAAEDWLAHHPYRNEVLRWDTDRWGENPADFGRK